VSDELKQLRSKIDAIDKQLLVLLGKRAQCAVETRSHKESLKSDGIYDPEREKQVIEHMLAENDTVLPDAALSRVFQAIMDECRCLQK
jgi:chorismate mutase / prephenate dehydratase